MDPTLESVLFAPSNVALNVNKISRSVEPENTLFRHATLNEAVIFKYPNFDAAQESGAATVPGLEDFLGTSKTKKAVRTAIFVPKDANDLRLGGFGLFLDDDKIQELSERYIGLRIDPDRDDPDIKTLRILDDCPSFDPFLIKEAFDIENVDLHEKYAEISEAEAAQVRDLIRSKLKPIIARALDFDHAGKIEKSSKQFLDTIWDPRDQSGAHFIAAFGIGMKEAPKVFAAWKGVAYFDNEFKQRQSGSLTMIKWLKSDMAVPSDYAKLTRHEKQQFDMFKQSVIDRLLNVSRNISAVLERYDACYATFIDENKPRAFQEFLMSADKYYWTLGGCNGVLSQTVSTWKRYMGAASGGRLTYDVSERMMKVCDAIMRAKSEDDQIAL